MHCGLPCGFIGGDTGYRRGAGKRLCRLLAQRQEALLDVGLSLAKLNSRPLARLLDGDATLVVENGRFLHHRMRRARLTEDDILESVRDSQGIEHIEQVKFAIVERNGKISIIPAE